MPIIALAADDVSWLPLVLYAVFAGLIPMLGWSLLLWWFDRYEKEPLTLLGFAFLWGVAPAAIFSLTIERMLGFSMGPDSASTVLGVHLIRSGLIGPAVEEGLKFLGTVGILWVARAEIDGVLDGIIYAGLVGFGFATAENVLVFLASPSEAQLLPPVLLRAWLFGLNHAMFSAFAGYGLAKAKYAASPSRAAAWAIGGLCFAILLHAAFNAGIVLAASYPMAMGVSIVISFLGVNVILWLYMLALQREGEAIRSYLTPFREKGLLGPEEWLCATSIRSRLRAEWDAILHGDWASYRRISRLQTLFAQLALTTRQIARLGRSPDLEHRLDSIHRELFPALKKCP